jgi:hypothetical protein
MTVGDTDRMFDGKAAWCPISQRWCFRMKLARRFGLMKEMDQLGVST